MEKRWLELYEKLVNTDTGFEVPIEEKLQRTQFIADILSDMGFEVKRGKASHIATAGDPPYITLIGHLDTVFNEEVLKGWKFEMEGDVVRGPGVADMKGGIIVLLASLEEFLKETRNVPIAVVLNVDEEIGSPMGKEDHYEMAKKSLFCLSFETGRKDMGIVMSRKGIATMNLVVYGKAGHASLPQHGANALVEMAYKVIDVVDLSKKYDTMTVTPTIATAGYKANVIPDRAEVTFDIRYVTLEDIKKFRIDLEGIFLTPHIDGTEISYSIEIKRPPMVVSPLAEKVAKSAMNKLNVDYPMLFVGGGGDASFYAKKGVPAIDGLGIVGRYIHSRDEEAYLDTFEPRVRFVQELLAEITKNV